MFHSVGAALRDFERARFVTIGVSFCGGCAEAVFMTIGVSFCGGCAEGHLERPVFSCCGGGSVVVLDVGPWWGGG